MNYIDIIILIFIGLTCFQAYSRGFIKTLFDTIGLIVAFFLSKEFNYIIESFLLEHTKLYEKIYIFFKFKAKGVTKILQSSSGDIVNNVRESMKLPVELQHILSNMFNPSQSSNQDVVSIFVDNISLILLRTISFAITFLCIYIIIVMLSNLISLICKLPVLNLVNKIMGAATGGLKSIMILYIVFALFAPLIGFTQDNMLTNSIVKSKSSEIFYENNIILNYLSYKGFYENQIKGEKDENN